MRTKATWSSTVLPVSKGSLSGDQVTATLRRTLPLRPTISPTYSPPAAVRLTTCWAPALVVGNTRTVPRAVHTAAWAHDTTARNTPTATSVATSAARAGRKPMDPFKNFTVRPPDPIDAARPRYLSCIGSEPAALDE